MSTSFDDFFEEFRDDVLGELSARKVAFGLVDFVNLGASTWTTIDAFEKMQTLPRGKKRNIETTDAGTWSGVPQTFSVVLKDGRWLHYKTSPDPRDRKWELLSLPTRAKKYVEK